jgi:hypothetical protein
VKQNILKIFVPIVAVGPPAARVQINFHIAGARRGVADLQNGVAEIRPTFEADEPGVKNADAYSIGGFQFAAFEPLMLPDGLQEPLRWKMFVAQKTCRDGLRPPLRVKLFIPSCHLEIVFAPSMVQSQARKI